MKKRHKKLNYALYGNSKFIYQQIYEIKLQNIL